MMRAGTTLSVLGIVILLRWAPLLPSGQAPQKDVTLVIRGATLIDGTGRAPQRNSVVVVRGNAIAEVASASEKSDPSDARVIDATGKYLLPGLIDTHAHLQATNGIGLSDEQKARALDHNPKAFLYNGVTTIINLSSEIDWILKQRQLKADGGILSPRIFTGGAHFTAPGGWGSRHGGAVASIQEARERLDQYFARGVDLVKVIYEDGLGSAGVFPRLDRSVMAAIAETCKRHRIPLFIHAMDIVEYRDAVAVAPRAIVHGLEDPIAPGDPLLREIASKGIFVTPTVVLFESFYRYFDEPSLLDAPVLKRSVPDFVIESVRRQGNLEKARAAMNGIMKMDVFQWARKKFPVYKENVKKFADAGIRLTVGTDSGGAVVHAFQGYNTPREVELLVEAGLTPMQAIVAGTRNGAALIGAGDRLGTIEVGKLADMILLNADPLENTRHLRDIDLVIQNGRVFSRAELAYLPSSSSAASATPSHVAPRRPATNAPRLTARRTWGFLKSSPNRSGQPFHPS